tara:strand:+ start:218 stop:1123 length:906 start_codon:yes stop_codon:yes gene_type:complete
VIKLLSDLKTDNLINSLRGFSWEAAEIMLHYSQEMKNINNDSKFVKFKNNNEPVTIADLEVNKLIINRINSKYPGIKWGFLSEENFKEDTYQDFDHEWLWVLDPLDGTKDFIQGTGNYAMHLALNYRNRPFIGVVLIPERNELWISNGENLSCENKSGHQKNISLTRNKTLQQMTIVSSKNHKDKHLENLLSKITCKNLITMGSIGCKIASILRGESDLYISLSDPSKNTPKDWDYAAPNAILKAAGGVITNLNNEEIKYNKANLNHGGLIIASNDKFNHKYICNHIKTLIDEYNLIPFEY